ncbi:glycine receptor subunit alpha-2-like [Ruditapes philippinarum]|uniref:glycine receptor subunit alpha-2-like n=1 Tax=Ruditapes philippinarum TaxID=129788 RepID=UPI00295C2D25|nr:glycine receptor subunit alpha-2-like [Ruditapes philippinarum]
MLRVKYIWLAITGSACLSVIEGLQNGTHTDQSFRKTLIKDLFSNYDSRLAPNPKDGGSTNVSVQILITSIDTISETNMDFSISIFLRQKWMDSRLVYKPSSAMRSLELDASSISKVWIPDLYIPSEKSAIVHHVTVPNKLMHVFPDGKIQYSLRISATIKCNFDLRKFPLDLQHCFVEMESYGYTTDTLRFEWDKTPINIDKSMQIPGTKTTGQCDKEYFEVGFSCVRFDFWMKRSVGYYVTQVFIPSFLIVFLSWVSFWLDIDAVPARISLGLLTVLTMTTQSAGARNNLPKVSYLKAIDVWMAVCLGFVFLALVQFAYVNVLSRVEKRRKLTTHENIPVDSVASEADVDKLTPSSSHDAGLTSHDNFQKEMIKLKIPGYLKQLDFRRIMKEDREKARNVDRVSRILFPVAFLIFNIVYWFTYVFWEPKAIDGN